MTTKTAVGFSAKIDSFLAGQEAAAQALAKIQPFYPHFVLCYCSDKHNPHEFHSGVRSLTGDAQLVGGTAFGVFTNDKISYESFECNVALFYSDHISFQVVAQPDLNKDEYAAGVALSEKITQLAKGDEKGLILFYDSVKQTNPPMLNFASPLCKAIEERINPSITCVGAGILGNMSLTNCVLFCNDHVVTQHVVAVLISGDCQFHNSILHGCEPASSYKQITRAEGPVIYEIENRPAVEVVDELLGKNSIKWSEFALFVTLGLNKGDKFGNFHEEDYVNRVCLAVNEVDKAMIMFEPDVKTGDEVQLMARSINLDYIKHSISKLKQRIKNEQPLFCFYINCAGRMKTYAGGELEDVEEVQKSIGPELPFMGFYSGVEIARVGGQLQPLDWTGVLCLLTANKNGDK